MLIIEKTVRDICLMESILNPCKTMFAIKSHLIQALYIEIRKMQEHRGNCTLYKHIIHIELCIFAFTGLTYWGHAFEMQKEHLQNNSEEFL